MDEASQFGQKRILIAGANGIVGRHLAERLQSHFGLNGNIVCLSRRADSDNAKQKATWLQGDLELRIDLPKVDLMFHCAPIWLLPKHIESLARSGLKRLIAFSSTSAITKADSRSEEERSLSRLLQESEQAVIRNCVNAGLAYTVFRPTMIYGYGEDHNISTIARFIRRFRFFVVAGQAKGLRQPVHVDDLVAASTAAVGAKAAINRTYDLAGGEVMEYREMVQRIFRALGLEPHIVSLPVALYRVLLQALGRISGNNSYSGGMADRMNEDLNFDYTGATTDLGYSPQKFLSDPQRDLVLSAR